MYYILSYDICSSWIEQSKENKFQNVKNGLVQLNHGHLNSSVKNKNPKYNRTVPLNDHDKPPIYLYIKTSLQSHWILYKNVGRQGRFQLCLCWGVSHFWRVSWVHRVFKRKKINSFLMTPFSWLEQFPQFSQAKRQQNQNYTR